EQVERTRPLGARAQPVEERLAHPVGGWTDGDGGRKAQLSAAPCSSDDAQRARAAAAPCGGGCTAACLARGHRTLPRGCRTLPLFAPLASSSFLVQKHSNTTVSARPAPHSGCALETRSGV